MTKQNYVIWIQLVSLLMYKKNVFMKSLQKMLKKDLKLQIMSSKDRFQKEKKEVIGVMKDELARKIMKEFVGLKAKTCSYFNR